MFNHSFCTENRTLEGIPEYSDISGIGVVIGYTATAGITVFIITGYYFVAHDPGLDPFRSNDKSVQQQVPYTPHPVDELMLRRARGLWRKIRKIKSEGNKKTIESANRKSGLERALLKCVLTMSDLQILTGLSILISGYAQLDRGLSFYHWHLMVYLAWFCSLTHLSCLTFLRNHLYNHPGERIWRLIGMGTLVILLIVALLPTGNYNSTDPADYAICSFLHLAPKSKNRTIDYRNRIYNLGGELDYAAMIISVLLVGFGFLSRVVRLHRSLAVGIIAAGRTYISERSLTFLRNLYRKCKEVPDPPPRGQERGSVSSLLRKSSLRILCFYRPLLAIYLTIRVIADLWSSLILELWWLIVSFAWGVFNISLSLEDGPDPQNWTFGQIVPVILLLAPVLSIIELLFDSSSDEKLIAGTKEGVEQLETPPRTETSEIVASMNSAPPDGVHDGPDHDYYQEPWFQSFISYFLFVIAFLSAFILLIPSPKKGENLRSLIPEANFLTWLPLAVWLSAINFVLYSLILEGLQIKPWLKWSFCWGSSFVVYVLFCLVVFRLAYFTGFGVLQFCYLLTCAWLAAKAQLT